MATDSQHDYYALLGVHPEIGFAELRRVWRRLARRWHPDHAGHTATATFQHISAAYEVLSDPVARAAYDRRRGIRASRSPNSSTGSPTDTAPRRKAPGVALRRRQRRHLVEQLLHPFLDGALRVPRAGGSGGPPELVRDGELADHLCQRVVLSGDHLLQDLAGLAVADEHAAHVGEHARLDERACNLYYCNAGHNYPFVLKPDGKVMSLVTGGLLLGAFPSVQYQSDVVALCPGDVLILYTDGLTEMMDSAEKEYGETRLIEEAKRLMGLPVEAICARLISSVKQFASGPNEIDDITLVVMKTRERMA